MIGTHTQRKRSVNRRSKFKDLPVLGGEAVWTHTLAITVGGLAADPATAAAGNKLFAGVVVAGFDNTEGADGALAPLPERWCKVSKAGRWLFEVEAASPAPERGADAFIFDNDLVTADGVGRIKCGVFWEAEGTHWWVDIDNA